MGFDLRQRGGTGGEANSEPRQERTQNRHDIPHPVASKFRSIIPLSWSRCFYREFACIGYCTLFTRYLYNCYGRSFISRTLKIPYIISWVLRHRPRKIDSGWLRQGDVPSLHLGDWFPVRRKLEVSGRWADVRVGCCYAAKRLIHPVSLRLVMQGKSVTSDRQRKS